MFIDKEDKVTAWVINYTHNGYYQETKVWWKKDL